MFLLPGAYRNFDDVEDCLCLAEISFLIEKGREEQHTHRKFLAAIQGIDLDAETQKDDAFEKIKERALAKATGRTEDEVALDGLIDFEDEDDWEGDEIT